MEDIMKADIFFFVTTFIVIVLGIISAIAIVFLVRILQRFDRLSDAFEKEAHSVLDDFSSFRGSVKTILSKAETLFSVFSRIASFYKKPTKKSRSKKNK